MTRTQAQTRAGQPLTPGPTGNTPLLIDRGLADAPAGRTYATVDPSTGEPLGLAADAGADDMDAAIGAARRAFDTTDWARDHRFRARCLRRLRDGLQSHIEELREVTIAEAGAPAFFTSG